MEIIIHRINTLKGLKEIPHEYGTEIDIRAWNDKLILNHEPFQSGELLVDYLDEYQHGMLILNIKEAGIEGEVLRLIRERPVIKNYFLLDVEFPICTEHLEGERNIAIRFSEDESIETVQKYQNSVDWVWIDTNTKLPIDQTNIAILNRFKKCLVCPERWGRPNDIQNYKKLLDSLNFNINAVMTELSMLHYGIVSSFLLVLFLLQQSLFLSRSNSKWLRRYKDVFFIAK